MLLSIKKRLRRLIATRLPRRLLYCGLLSLVAACCVAADAVPKKSPIKSPRIILDSQLGTKVTLHGQAFENKHGALLHDKTFDVWMDGVKHWPKELVGRPVVASGILIKRTDLHGIEIKEITPGISRMIDIGPPTVSRVPSEKSNMDDRPLDQAVAGCSSSKALATVERERRGSGGISVRTCDAGAFHVEHEARLRD